MNLGILFNVSELILSSKIVSLKWSKLFICYILDVCKQFVLCDPTRKNQICRSSGTLDIAYSTNSATVKCLLGLLNIFSDLDMSRIDMTFWIQTQTILTSGPNLRIARIIYFLRRERYFSPYKLPVDECHHFQKFLDKLLVFKNLVLSFCFGQFYGLLLVNNLPLIILLSIIQTKKSSFCNTKEIKSLISLFRFFHSVVWFSIDVERQNNYTIHNF